MQLGAFSVSLGVKDLAASRVFYEALGFTAYAGTEEHNYLIMKNGDTLVGLFQGDVRRRDADLQSRLGSERHQCRPV